MLRLRLGRKSVIKENKCTSIINIMKIEAGVKDSDASLSSTKPPSGIPLGGGFDFD